jgi:hypothetical protein
MWCEPQMCVVNQKAQHPPHRQTGIHTADTRSSARDTEGRRAPQRTNFVAPFLGQGRVFGLLLILWILRSIRMEEMFFYYDTKTRLTWLEMQNVDSSFIPSLGASTSVFLVPARIIFVLFSTSNYN